MYENQSRQVKIIRQALRFYGLISGAFFHDRDEIKKTEDEIEQILGIDSEAELKEIINILNQQAQSEREGKVKDCSEKAVLGKYERELDEGRA